MRAAMENSRRHRITADEYYRMGERNLFAPDARMELIEGVIIDMPPLGNPHMSTVDRLTRLLIRTLGDKAILRGQGSVRLGDYSVPQPDLLLLEPRDDFYRRHTATARDVLLLIEVSDSTLRFDLHEKVPLYAKHGIREVWVLDVQGCRASFFRSPRDGEYHEIVATTQPGPAPIAALPEVTVDLSFLANASV